MTSTRSDVTPNRRGARSRETVLDAAERVMAEQGYAAASINAIVQEAGIPISSVYHYFGSKDGVLLAVMERGAERFFADIPDVAERIGTADQHLAAMAAALVAALERHPDFLKLVIVMTAQPPPLEAAHAHEVVSRVRDTALRRLAKNLGLAFDADAQSGPIRQLAHLCLAIVDGAFIAIQAEPELALEQFLEPLPMTLAGVFAALDT